MGDTDFVGYLILTPTYDNITEFNERFISFSGDDYRAVVGNYESFRFSQNILPQAWDYNYALFTSPPGETGGIGIPTRTTFIYASLVGKISNEQAILNQVEINDASNQAAHLLPAKLLARINRVDSSDNEVTNYRNLVYDRVYKKIEGVFASHLAYISPKPSLILLSKNIPVFISLVYYKGLYILMWGTQQNLLQDFEKFLHVNYSKDSYFSFCCPMLTLQDSILVMCPSFLVSKIRKWKQSYKQKGGSILIASNLKSYLARINVGENETCTWLDQ